MLWYKETKHEYTVHLSSISKVEVKHLEDNNEALNFRNLRLPGNTNLDLKLKEKLGVCVCVCVKNHEVVQKSECAGWLESF